MLLVEAIATPPIIAAMVPPCANTRSFIIRCDMIMLPLLNENKPSDSAPTVAKHPVNTEKIKSLLYKITQTMLYLLLVLLANTRSSGYDAHQVVLRGFLSSRGRIGSLGTLGEAASTQDQLGKAFL